MELSFVNVKALCFHRYIFIKGPVLRRTLASINNFSDINNTLNKHFHAINNNFICKSSNNLVCNYFSNYKDAVMLINYRSIYIQSNLLGERKKPVKFIGKAKVSPRNTGEEEEEDTYVDSDFEFIEKEKGVKTIIQNIQNLRLDSLLKLCLGFSRNSIEKSIYKGMVRVNGKKPPKISMSLTIGDYADLIDGFSPDNKNYLIVSRIELVDFKKAGERSLRVKMKTYKSYLIENYEDPWSSTQSEEEGVEGVCEEEQEEVKKVK